jgi:hypothetical protein
MISLEVDIEPDVMARGACGLWAELVWRFLDPILALVVRRKNDDTIAAFFDIVHGTFDPHRPGLSQDCDESSDLRCRYTSRPSKSDCR